MNADDDRMALCYFIAFTWAVIFAFFLARFNYFGCHHDDAYIHLPNHIPKVLNRRQQAVLHGDVDLAVAITLIA